MKQIPEDPEESRRVVVMIPHGYIVALFSGGMIGADFVRLPKSTLPETARVVSVHEAPEYDAFMLIVQDASFEPCQQGCRYPRLEIEWEEIQLERHKQE